MPALDELVLVRELRFRVIDDIDVVGFVCLDLDDASAGRVVLTIVMIG